MHKHVKVIVTLMQDGEPKSVTVMSIRKFRHIFDKVKRHLSRPHRKHAHA